MIRAYRFPVKNQYRSEYYNTVLISSSFITLYCLIPNGPIMLQKNTRVGTGR